MTVIGAEAPAEAGARELLLDRAMGPDRFLKSSERLREGRLPAAGLALVARDGDALVGTVRLWNVAAGGRDALLLGPLAVAPERQSEGLGSKLMRAALNRAAMLGHGASSSSATRPTTPLRLLGASRRRLLMPGPVDRRRFLALELRGRCSLGAAGLLVPTGDFAAPSLVGPDFEVLEPLRLAA